MKEASKQLRMFVIVCWGKVIGVEGVIRLRNKAYAR